VKEVVSDLNEEANRVVSDERLWKNRLGRKPSRSDEQMSWEGKALTGAEHNELTRRLRVFGKGKSPEDYERAMNKMVKQLKEGKLPGWDTEGQRADLGTGKTGDPHRLEGTSWKDRLGKTYDKDARIKVRGGTISGAEYNKLMARLKKFGAGKGYTDKQYNKAMNKMLRGKVVPKEPTPRAGTPLTQPVREELSEIPGATPTAQPKATPTTTPTTTGQQKPVERQGATTPSSSPEDTQKLIEEFGSEKLFPVTKKATSGLGQRAAQRNLEGNVAAPVSVGGPITDDDLADMLLQAPQTGGAGSFLGSLDPNEEKRRWGVSDEKELELLVQIKNPLPPPRGQQIRRGSRVVRTTRPSQQALDAYNLQQGKVRQYIEMKLSRDEKIHPHVNQNYPGVVKRSVDAHFPGRAGQRRLPNRELQHYHYTKDLQEAEREQTRPGWEKYGVYSGENIDKSRIARTPGGKGWLADLFTGEGQGRYPRAISPATGEETVPPPYPMGTLPRAPRRTGLQQPSLAEISPPGEGVPRFMQQPNPHGDIRARSTQTPSPLPTGALPPQPPSSPSVMGFPQPSMSDIYPPGEETPPFMQPPNPYGDIRGLTPEELRMLGLL
jgi:hypothetical protein